MTIGKQIAKTWRDHEWRQGLPAEVIKIQAIVTVKRMLAVMNMTKNVELMRYIGCHNGQSAKWQRKEVLLLIVHFINQDVNVTLDYLLYGPTTTLKLLPKHTNEITCLIVDDLDIGQQISIPHNTENMGLTSLQ